MAAEPPEATGLPALLPPSHFRPRPAAVARSERGRSLRLGAELEAPEGRGLELGAGLEEEPEQCPHCPQLRARLAALTRILELQELELAVPMGPPPWRRLLGGWRAQVFRLLLERSLRERRGRSQALAVALAGQRRRAEVAEEALGDLLEATRGLARWLSGHQRDLVAATRRLDGFGHRLERAARGLRRLRGRVAPAPLRWPPAGDRASPEVTGGAESSRVAPARVTPEEVTRDAVAPEEGTRDKGTRRWVPLGPQLQAPPREEQLPPPGRGALGTLVWELRALGAAILGDGDVTVTSPP